ncbi:hypothetical protein PENTCL1PPCAC_14594, partial [Pristionchus entomophagus]
FAGRRPPWQATLRALADKESCLYVKKNRAPPVAPFEGTPIVLSVETSELRPAKEMSSQVAIPPLMGLKGMNEMDFTSPEALSSRFADVSANFPPIDTHGGTIVEVNETEETDASDGARVQVLVYRILMADGNELMKTVRRKFQLQCTAAYSRTNYVNGEQVGDIDFKATRMERDIKGFAPMQISNQPLYLDENDPGDQRIASVFRETQNRMQNMFMAEKEKMMALFPQLFKPADAPTAKKEIIVNADGSITERTVTKKSMSSHFSKSETYIDGKKQKTKLRAFVEYDGPEGGFKVKLANGDEGDLSEEETENDDDWKSHYAVYELGQKRSENAVAKLAPGSRKNDDDVRSRLSEIRDDESVVAGKVVKKGLTSALEKRMERAWHAAKELVDSEKRYVDKLKLLDEMFRKKIVAEKVIEQDKISKLFANTESLHTFHNSHLLPQLMDASREWQSTKRISSIMRKQAPFLKMYSEYTNNYKRATKLFEESMVKKKRFNEIVREIEKDPMCENLPLISHLICPVQRVMRYQLLLQEYKKHLVESDADYADTVAALDLVLEAASHANEMMKKLDRYGKVIEVQEQLGNAISLVHPGRELLRQGSLQKISSSTGKTEERFVFLFNDLIVLASERNIPTFSKYKLRAVFHAAHSQVCEGDNLEREFSFYIRGSDGGSGQIRTLELFCETQKEKEEWVAAFCQIIDDASHSLASTNNRVSTYSTNGAEKNCAECDEEYGLLSRGYRYAARAIARAFGCSQCTRKLCKKCFGRYRNESKSSRACETCVKHMGSSRMNHTSSPRSRRDVLAVPASSSTKDAMILHASPVKFRGTLGRPFSRYFVIRSNFCLYSYNSPDDERALTMLPLPGCEVKMTGEKHTFSLRIGSRRLYMITAEDDESQARWMASLDLVANAPINNPSSASSDNGSVSSR